VVRAIDATYAVSVSLMASVNLVIRWWYFAAEKVTKDLP